MMNEVQRTKVAERRSPYDDDRARIHQRLLGMAEKIEPRRTVVYVLFEGEEVAYVGQSRQPVGRLRSHDADPRMPFDRVAMFDVDGADLDLVERYLIALLNPKHNRARWSLPPDLTEPEPPEPIIDDGEWWYRNEQFRLLGRASAARYCGMDFWDFAMFINDPAGPHAHERLAAETYYWPIALDAWMSSRGAERLDNERGDRGWR